MFVDSCLVYTTQKNMYSALNMEKQNKWSEARSETITSPVDKSNKLRAKVFGSQRSWTASVIKSSMQLVDAM